jgi:hypothetical protein
MAEGQEAAAIIESALEVLYRTEFVEESLHDLIAALLRYILDKHFLPNFLLGPHCVEAGVLGTPRGLTVMLPPWVIMGVIVTGSRTK